MTESKEVCPKCGSEGIKKFSLAALSVILGFSLIISGSLCLTLIITIPLLILAWIVALFLFISAPFLPNKYIYLCDICGHVWEDKKEAKIPYGIVKKRVKNDRK